MLACVTPGRNGTRNGVGVSGSRDDQPVGLEGTLVLGTRGADGPGEVAVRIRGAREDFIAYSTAPIAAGRAVLVVEMRSNRVVTVVPWPSGDLEADD
jgi:hypothetical protein